MQPELLTHSGLRLIVRFLQARYGLIFDATDQAGELALAAAVDADRERDPSGPPLQIKVMPEIASSVVRGRAKALRKQDEVEAVREALGLGPTGQAMIAPILLENERAGGLLVLASIERPNWSPTDLEILKAWAHYLGRKINSWPDLTEDARPEETEMLKGELRLALEELAEVGAIESGASIAQVGTLTSQLMEMHEPITSIRGYNEMLRSGAIGNLEPDQRTFLDHIRENAIKLDQQLKGLLDLVRAPQTSIQTLIDLSAVIDIAETQVATDLEKSGIEIERSISKSLPRVSVDSDLLRQIVVILLERAIRISPSNSQINIAAQEEEGGWISIAVSDQGPGVPAEDLGRAFQPGVESEGADLGLPQAKLLSDSLGGRVWIGSEMGSGSTVTVLIPASEGTVAAAS
jgi:signal transduction histidine kinase